MCRNFFHIKVNELKDIYHQIFERKVVFVEPGKINHLNNIEDGIISYQ